MVGLTASVDAATGEGEPLAIIQTVPVENASEVPTTQPVMVHFSKEIDPKTLTPATFSVEGTTGVIQYDPALKSATWTPAAPLEPSKTYRATLSDEIADLDGLRLPFPYSWTFTTQGAAEQAGPLAIQQTTPAPNADHVPVNASVSVTFNKEIDPESLRPDQLLLMRDGQVAGTLRYDRAARSVIFTPASPLEYQETYTATVREGIKDPAGNRLPLGKSWTFTTETPPPPLAGLAP
ncbi:MAG TPA: Ig-like domain-containing protein [Candidatus Manganitrophaceae bacterium]|nr:Ig-like domain-containing protein [Candidatus Manganitrophaceae bacterium]